MDDQAMVITGRMNAMDRALLVVLAQASATDRQLVVLRAGLEEERRLRDEDRVRHTQEMKEERKRISDATAIAALVQEEERKRVSDATGNAALVQGQLLMEILAQLKEQREETKEIKISLAGGLSSQSTPMLSYP